MLCRGFMVLWCSNTGVDFDEEEIIVGKAEDLSVSVLLRVVFC